MNKEDGKVLPEGQRMISPAAGAKANDSFEKIRESGDAGPAKMPKVEECCKDQNTPYGQKVV